MTGRHLTRRCSLIAALLSLAGCTNKSTSPPSEASHSRRPESSRVAGGGADDSALFQRLGIPMSSLARSTPADSMLLERLRVPWQWIGPLHRGPKWTDVTIRDEEYPESAECKNQLEHMHRYFSKPDNAVRRVTDRVRNDVEALTRRMGGCVAPKPDTAGLNTAVGRFTTRASLALYAAHDLADVRRLIDAVHLDVIRERGISAADRQAVAALSVVALAAANKWFPTNALPTESRTDDGTDQRDAEIFGCNLMIAGIDCTIGAVSGALSYWSPIVNVSMK